MKVPGVRRLFRFPWRTREDVREDVRSEFRFHLDMRIEDLRREGLDEASARARALREFGSERSAERVCAVHGDRVERRRWLARLAGELSQDVTFAMRVVARNPGFALVTVLTLAIAIGANTAIFAVVNGLLFRPLPVLAPHELARVKAGETQMSWLNYEDVRRDNAVFEQTAAYRMRSLGLTTAERPLLLRGQETSDNFFSLLGVGPSRGRTYGPDDAGRGLVVLADRVWRSRFGADESLLGRTLMLGGRPYEVAGIMPALFRGVAPPGFTSDFWLLADPSVAGPAFQDRAESAFEVVGRLRPNVTHAQAAADLQVLARWLRSVHPEIPERFLAVEVFPVDGVRAFQGVARTLLPVFAFLGVMTVVAGFVLLIGCANIAGLLMGRAAARRHEIAMRLALGAGRGRLVRQLLTESLVLASAGGAAGVVLATWLAGGVDLLASRLPVNVELNIETDLRVLIYSGLATIVATLACGLLPARGAARFEVVSTLKDTHGGTPGSRRTRRALVVGQVAASAALLLWSGLFVRSLGRISDVDPGFDPAGVLVAGVVLQDDAGEAGERMLTGLHQRIADLPGVESAGLARIVPLAMEGREEFDVAIAASGGVSLRRVTANRLGPGWFETVRIPFIVGRDFTWEDRQGSPNVAIVNETLARQFWNGDALGKQFFHQNRQPVDVVGVVRDSKYWTLGETVRPMVYLPFGQSPIAEMSLHVRTADPGSATRAIVGELQQRAPGVAVEIEPMTEVVSVAMLPARVGAAVTAAFGVLAAFLSALGIYGLVSFSVVQRTREIGMRKALGAGTVDIARAIVGGSVTLTMTGLVFGLGLGALGGIALQGFIVGVSPLDPVTLLAAAGVVMSAAFLASIVPTLAAIRLDPLVALRDA